jgi:hypothetical protein
LSELPPPLLGDPEWGVDAARAPLVVNVHGGPFNHV